MNADGVNWENILLIHHLRLSAFIGGSYFVFLGTLGVLGGSIQQAHDLLLAMKHSLHRNSLAIAKFNSTHSAPYIHTEPEWH